ncbi:MAG: SGNH/GDSL hydrolase family protein [Ruminococcaceae bacterium]|nr:SGNH/GDSL hydrolase family protein [Oscillospiraceae bacterium]
MSQDTYQFDKKTSKLETFEWDDIWFEKTSATPEMRIAYIGDSISRGTRRLITALSDGKILCDGYATSKALDNPCLFPQLSLFAKQQGHCDAVLFNNGLHGWHLDDEKDYSELLEKTLRFLKEEFPSSRLILVLTTFLANEKQTSRVKSRNAAALAIAEGLGIEVLDLYSLTEANKELLIEDGVHFKKEGYEKIAAAAIRKLVEKR